MIKNTMYSIFARLLQIATPILLVPLIITSVGIDEFGRFSYGIVVSSIFCIIVQHGLHFYLPREVAKVCDDKRKLSFLFFDAISLQIVLAIIAFLIFNLYLLYESKSYNIEYQLIFGFTVIQILIPYWLFQGLQKMHLVAYLQTSQSILLICTLILIPKDIIDIKLISFTYFFIYTFSLLMSIWLSIKVTEMRLNLPNTYRVCAIYKGAWSEFVQQLAPNMYNSGLIFLFGMHVTNTEFAIFNIAQRIVTAASSLAISACQAVYPAMILKPALFPKYNLALVSFSAIITILILFIPKELIAFVASSEDEEIMNVLMYLSISPVLLCISRVYGPNFLNFIGKNRLVQNYITLTSIAFGTIGYLTISSNPLTALLSCLIGARLLIAVFGFISFTFLFKKQKFEIE